MNRPTLTKAELAVELTDRLGLNKRESKDMLDAFFDMIHAALVSGQDVKLADFGTFTIRRRLARIGRNPRTGETVPIPARTAVRFLAARKVKKQVRNDIGAVRESSSLAAQPEFDIGTG